MNRAQYEQWAREAAARYGVPVDIMLNSIQKESGWNPEAVSNKGAVGIAQFMPGTAKRFGIDPTDPQQSIDAMGKYYRQNYDLLGSWDKAVAGYNWGEGNVQKNPNFQQWPKETRDHVSYVMASTNNPDPALQPIPRGYQPPNPQGQSLMQQMGYNSKQKMPFMPGEMTPEQMKANKPKADIQVPDIDLNDPASIRNAAQALGVDATSGMDIKSKNQLEYDLLKKRLGQNQSAEKLPGYGHMPDVLAAGQSGFAPAEGYVDISGQGAEGLRSILGMLLSMNNMSGNRRR